MYIIYFGNIYYIYRYFCTYMEILIPVDSFATLATMVSSNYYYSYINLNRPLATLCDPTVSPTEQLPYVNWCEFMM